MGKRAIKSGRTRKCVITGAPGTGKTTVVNKLSSLGYYVVPEAARLIIERGAKLAGKSILEIKKWNYDFQRRVLKMQIELEKAIPKGEEIIFLDRGILDGIAYLAFVNLKPFPELIEAAKKYRYYKVFCLETLPFYHPDNVRNESKDDAEKLQTLIKKVYSDFGYKVIRVPAVPINERVKLILNSIV